VQAACDDLRRKVVQLAVTDRASPLRGADPESIEARDGRLVAAGSSRTDSYRQILARRRLEYVDGQAETAPGSERDAYSMYAFGSVFAEVRVDPDFGTVRVSRLVGVYGAGRILNAKTARSQLIGGMVWGIGMALLEDTVFDHRSGRIVNGSLAEYLVPVEADVPDLDASFVEEHDPYVNPLGVKGIGEVGITGVAPAIANAVYHATGIRVRDLPITLDKVMGASTSPGAV
jgi:xanthine dehydrogenase YagR molybdenum-binding subunit